MHDFNSKMNETLLQLLYGLINNWENEVVEFKEASNSFKQDEIGQYFSAISNEANLKGLQYGWLVFGVNNKTREIVNTDYRDARGLETLKHEIADNTTGRITFTDVFEIYEGGKRVIMFKIPAAVTAIPTDWKGRWYGREGESLSPLSIEELERLRGQVRRDWSKQLIEGSNVKHLDMAAIKDARAKYKEKQNREHISIEIDKMSDEEFLTKINLVIGGRLTNAAMVLLGNPDYEYIIDTPVRLMWRFYGSNGIVKDYSEFKIPFIGVVDKVYDKIRNLVYRYLPDVMTLFPTVTQQYDINLIKELLNNCIAHMDYTTGGRIYLDEFEDLVVISNPGSFIPKSVRTVLTTGYRAPFYRNQLIADSMKELNMIDTVQMGILRVFNIQRDRYFPLPDYDLHSKNEVSVKVYGKLLDENYTRHLFNNTDLSMDIVYLLDQVQKNIPIAKDEYKTLRCLGLIYGNPPNVRVSVVTGRTNENQVMLTEHKSLDDSSCKQLIIDYLLKQVEGTKADFEKLLSDKLSDNLDEKQKDNKVRSLIRTMQRNKLIERTTNNKRTGAWRLTHKG